VREWSLLHVYIKRAIMVSLAQDKNRKREINLMKKMFAAFVVLLGVGAPGLKAQLISSFEDIEYWVGSGTNQSVLAIQWSDGGDPKSLAWGYRWNDMATGLDMLTAIAGLSVVEPPSGGDPIETIHGADVRLSLVLWRYGFGDSLYSASFGSGETTRTQADWDSGYWQYWIYGGDIEYTPWDETEPSYYQVSGSSNYSSVTWWNSQVGASDRPLINNSWDAYVFLPGFAAQVVAQPTAAAIPEPSTWVLLGLSALTFGIWRIRRAARRV
jgi:hypothetical protein